MSRPRKAFFALAALSAALAAGAAAAQAYPSKPVRLITPFPPGGVADIWSRAYAQELTRTWGQPVVVDNRPGAGTTIGADIVAKAPADGHTIFLTNLGHSISAALYAKLPYDVQKDFAPITLLGDVTSILAASPALPASTTKELIALARAKPGQLNFASAGNGTASHLFGEYLKLQARIDLVHVPYKGTAPALADLIGGRVNLIFEPMPSVLPHVRAGKLKALGVTTAKRSQAAPEIPPIAEAGLPGFDVTIWYGVLAPARTPQPIVTRLHGELVRITRSPEMKERFTSQGAEPVASTPQEFAATIGKDMKRWSQVITEAKISVN